MCEEAWRRDSDRLESRILCFFLFLFCCVVNNCSIIIALSSLFFLPEFVRINSHLHTYIRTQKFSFSLSVTCGSCLKSPALLTFCNQHHGADREEKKAYLR